MHQFIHILRRATDILLKVPYNVFMKIAEPRVKRLIYFTIYGILAFSGVGVIVKPPASMVNILGGILLVYLIAAFIVIGAVVALFSVLPGIWWFERIGLYSIALGVVLYSVTMMFLGASPFAVFFPLIVILLLTLRWLDIREFLLAPREG